MVCVITRLVTLHQWLAYYQHQIWYITIHVFWGLRKDEWTCHQTFLIFLTYPLIVLFLKKNMNPCFISLFIIYTCVCKK